MSRENKTAATSDARKRNAENLAAPFLSIARAAADLTADPPRRIPRSELLRENRKLRALLDRDDEEALATERENGNLRVRVSELEAESSELRLEVYTADEEVAGLRRRVAELEAELAESKRTWGWACEQERTAERDEWRDRAFAAEAELAALHSQAADELCRESQAMEAAGLGSVSSNPWRESWLDAPCTVCGLPRRECTKESR